LFELAGKRALVTGASSGLGAGFARALAGAGAELVLAARRMEPLEALAGEIAAAGGKAVAVSMDVTSAQSVERAFETMAQTGEAADIIVNNSGVSREAWIADMEEVDWDLVMDTNLKGVWRVAKASARALMTAGKGGSVINIASITARRSSQTIAAYAASKAAVEHLTRAMALEWARSGIRVNAIAPGYFLTDINADFFETDAGEAMVKRIPMRRLGQLEELSGPLLLLASDAGAYMTGATLVVDGGHLQSSL
jgi:NAD(P)-dependent dehydrogenase (short-subunit alcohol dehydrogenase family)